MSISCGITSYLLLLSFTDRMLMPSSTVIAVFPQDKHKDRSLKTRGMSPKTSSSVFVFWVVNGTPLTVAYQVFVKNRNERTRTSSYATSQSCFIIVFLLNIQKYSTVAIILAVCICILIDLKKNRESNFWCILLISKLLRTRRYVFFD